MLAGKNIETSFSRKYCDKWCDHDKGWKENCNL